MSALEEKLQAMSELVGPFVSRHDKRSQELAARVLQLEQAVVSRGPGGPTGFGVEKSLGSLVVDSENFAAFRKGARSTGQIPIGAFKASTIVSGTWTTGPDFLPRVAAPPMPTLPLRTLIPSFVTTSNMVEYAKEISATDGADYQVNEGDAKAQSDLGFQLVQAPVATIATWAATSRQAIDDSPALANYLNTRLAYFVESKVESEILFGSGSSGHLRGLCPQASVASGTASDLIQAVANAAAQLAAIGVTADGVVCNAQDFWAARTLKAAGSGQFLIGDPLSPLPPSLWNLPLSISPAMPHGQYLVGAFRTQSAIGDRQEASIELSREHADYFVRNLVSILVELRMTLLCFRGEAFVYGTLSGVGS